MSLFFKNSLFGLLILVSASVYSQNKVAPKETNQEKPKDTLSTESVIVIKTFNPTINDAFKVRLTPDFKDKKLASKQDLSFKINSIPVASTFEPKKNKSVAVTKQKQEQTYDNYALLGGGNFVNILAEVFVSTKINRNSQFTALLEHQSSQGGIKDVDLDNFFYDTGLQLSYTKQQKKAQWTLDLEAQHQLYNWYGLSDNLILTEQELNEIDPAHNFIDINVGANLSLDNEIIKGGGIQIRHFRDDFNSSENNLVIQPRFTIPLKKTQVKVPFTVDYLIGQFAEQGAISEIDYNILNFGITPTIALKYSNIDFKIGLSSFISNNFEEKDLDLYVYPIVEANYNLQKYDLNLFGGITGDLQQNTYHNAAEQNPFVSPTIEITPTSKSFDAYLGVKGRLQQNITYQLKASFESLKDQALWVKNPILNTGSSEILNFGFNNSFKYVYDDITAGKLKAEIGYEKAKYFTLLKTEFATYKADNQNEAWNLPSLKASLHFNYSITPKWRAGTNIFFIGNRKDINQFNSSTTTVDSYFDANLRMDYRITKRWSAFALGNNLLSQNYERWQDFKVQGIQFLAGAKYQF